ncbi:MAG: glycosyltransferase family 2 protein [Candidatus Omnitrophica bacterium]|nr:glycosyltransferase family 2 protein [Candidatus Omnitrophota bacterium]
MPVSVVMPCFNEKDVLEREVKAYYERLEALDPDFEFIVVDDNSLDGSSEILVRLAALLPRLKVYRSDTNMGYGPTVMRGYALCSKDFVFQVDSDGQFDPDDFAGLYESRDSADYILGYRRSRQDRLHRKVLSQFIRLVNAALFGVWLRDANCPFRLIRRGLLSELLKEIPPDALTPSIFLALLAKKKKLRILEVPVTHRPRLTGHESLAGVGRLVSFSARGFRQLWRWRKSLREVL